MASSICKSQHSAPLQLQLKEVRPSCKFAFDTPHLSVKIPIPEVVDDASSGTHEERTRTKEAQQVEAWQMAGRSGERYRPCARVVQEPGA